MTDLYVLSANYAQYAAAYAAQSGSYDQYQAAAAYNAAAYNAMQQQIPNSNNQNANKSANGAAGISISGTPQRYDYSTMNSQGTSGYDAAAYASNMMGGTGALNRPQNGPKWGQLPGQPGAPKFNKGQGGFNNRARRNPTGAPVQVFYCEVCKISCAGPQTYKEHLEGQKHKKREAANKINEAQALAAATGAPVTSSGDGANQNARNMGNRNNSNRPINSSNVVIQCALCDVACTGKDAYSAHVRGAKHQKTIKLHQKLGKPIPPDALEMMTANKQANGQAAGGPQAAVISAPPQINMNRPVSQNPVIGPVDPGANASENTNLPGSEVTMASNVPEIDENTINVEPIGKEYIETKLEGKILSFYCKLCECQFNDPNAKDMHTKGRRHRLAYKKKVDPSLKVDMKGNPRDDSKKRDRNGRIMSDKSLERIQSGQTGQIKPLMGTDNQPNQMSQGLQQLMSQSLKSSTQFNHFGQSNNYHVRHTETFDDKHLIAKHGTIYPTQDEVCYCYFNRIY